MRILVACASLVLAGGLIRFERVGTVLRRWGHDLAFVALGPRTDERWTSRLPVLTGEEAGAAEWDAVMVPGGGFPEEVVDRFSMFRQKRFGLRVQHLLNGPVRKPAYLRVTERLDPHLIVINNHHWRDEALAEFGARPVERLVGAVDTALFAPPVGPSPTRDRRRLGAIANKNPETLIDALRHLGEGWELHWFGRPNLHLLAAHHDLMAQGRLVPRGVLFGAELAAFYHDIDVFCSAEGHAGWCNPAAEAMASGVPLVTTIHGTLAFAHEGRTARLLAEATGPAVAGAVAALADAPEDMHALARQGRATIRDMTWESYTASLLTLVRRAGEREQGGVSRRFGTIRR